MAGDVYALPRRACVARVTFTRWRRPERVRSSAGRFLARSKTRRRAEPRLGRRVGVGGGNVGGLFLRRKRKRKSHVFVERRTAAKQTAEATAAPFSPVCAFLGRRRRHGRETGAVGDVAGSPAPGRDPAGRLRLRAGDAEHEPV